MFVRIFCAKYGDPFVGTIRQLIRFASSMPQVKPNLDEMPSTSVEIPIKIRPLQKSFELVHIGDRKSPRIHKKIKKMNFGEWTIIKPDSWISAYLQLSKSRLAALVTVTAMGGFAMAPAQFSLSTFTCCVLGTALLSACANTYNQFLEAPFDAQMKRTQARILVLDRLSPLHAVVFGTTVGIAGFALLLVGTNTLTALFGLANVLFYAGVYTPMKRHSILCTWMGAVVGAIPPIMGYVASCGGVDFGALALASVLYSWQFPHFNGLSWNLRGDYSRAGYRVMCVTDQEVCRRTTLRHSLALMFICSLAAPLSNLTTWTFAIDSLPLNIYMTYLSFKFYRRPDSNTSRTLFRYSLFYLPTIVLLMIVSNYGRTTKNRVKRLSK